MFHLILFHFACLCWLLLWNWILPITKVIEKRDSVSKNELRDRFGHVVFWGEYYYEVAVTDKRCSQPVRSRGLGFTRKILAWYDK